MHGIKVLMAKNYIDNLSEETRKGMLEKAEQSIYPSFAPLGYRNVMGPNGKRIIEPDPDIAPIITQIFQWYATGNAQSPTLQRGFGKPVWFRVGPGNQYQNPTSITFCANGSIQVTSIGMAKHTVAVISR